MKPRILIVEDNQGMLKMLERTLKKKNYEVTGVSRASDGFQYLRDQSFDVLITDLKLPDSDGLDVMKAAKAADPQMVVIVITAYGTIETAVEAMKLGATDFITKPFDTNLLLLQLERGTEIKRLQTENIVLKEVQAGFLESHKIVGSSRQFKNVTDQIKQVGPMDATVLLLGESGTGKEILAHAIHRFSKRKSAPFIAINCAAIPGELLENELFGHEKGAFTGAGSRKQGKLELADSGTLFLDEIGDMAPMLQAKLLRFLQERQLERVGGNKTIRVDVRIVAATNRDLKAAVRNSHFREDLFYRLSVFPIRIPPLRERPDDIPDLVEHFLGIYGRKFGKVPLTFAPSTIDRLLAYSWPGNVRELQNCIERAAIISPDGIIKPEHIAMSPIHDANSFQLSDIHLDGSLPRVVDRARRLVERKMIRKSLEKSGWNKSKAARDLGVNYKTLLLKIKEYEIE